MFFCYWNRKRKATDKEKALHLLFGKLKKKIPVTEKRIMKCRKTRKLSTRNKKKKHILDLEGHSSSLKTHTDINSCQFLPSSNFTGTTYCCHLLLMQKILSKRNHESKAGRHTIRIYPYLCTYHQPIGIRYSYLRAYAPLKEWSHRFWNKLFKCPRTVCLVKVNMN